MVTTQAQGRAYIESGPFRNEPFLDFRREENVQKMRQALERREGRADWMLLGHVWLQRFAYRQLFSLVLIKTLKRAAEGGAFSWDKLERKATVQAPVPVTQDH